MTTNFAKLMGHLKEIEISFTTLYKQLDINFSTYDDTIKQLTLNLENISILTKNITDKNIAEIKDILKKTSKINKQELDQPLKSVKKNLDQIETHLNKIIEQIKSYNNKSEQELKIIISPEENIILNNSIEELSAQIKTQKQRLDYLFGNLFTIQEKFVDIKQIINKYDFIKEELKFTKQISDFISKSELEEYVVTLNTDLLLEKLELLKNNIIKSKTTETLSLIPNQLEEKTSSKLLLNQFELKSDLNKSNGSNDEVDLSAKSNPTSPKTDLRINI